MKTTLFQFPARTNYAFMYQNPIWRTTNPIFHTFLPPQQDLFKKTVSSITFLNCPRVRSLLHVFRKDMHCKFLFLSSPSSLDLINIISLTYLDSWSNESSQGNQVEKLADFAGCRSYTVCTTLPGLKPCDTKFNALTLSLLHVLCLSGSEINFFIQAPSGDWKFFFSRQMKKSGRQKAVCKIFVS